MSVDRITFDKSFDAPDDEPTALVTVAENNTIKYL